MIANKKMELNFVEKQMRSFVQHFNIEKYWARRDYVINFSGGGILARLKSLYYLYYIKKCDAFNNASIGTLLGKGAEFENTPCFPHGIYGIIISCNAKVGKNCRIFHQVTIGTNGKGDPVIGDNVEIGAGAKVLGPIMVGNNVKIGANVVITRDIPDNSVVKMIEPQIIIKTNEERL